MKTDEYIEALKTESDKSAYILTYSNLPGKRGNLELARAAALVCDESWLVTQTTLEENAAPENTPQVLLVFSGVLGLGRLVTEGNEQYLDVLRKTANDSRWRIREAVAMALQWIGSENMDQLLAVLEGWMEGSLLELRAAAAGICEPALLHDPRHGEAVFDLLDRIVNRLVNEKQPKEAYKTLRQGMAYCLSVAAVYYPERGEKYFRQWMEIEDRDIRWVLKQNLGKKRLQKPEFIWAAEMKNLLESSKN